MRIMGVDYGTRRIGVAISDPSGTMAHPLETIPVLGDGSHLKQLEKVVRDYGIVKVVVGLPVNMDGSLGESALKVKEWAQTLERFLGVPVELWDERLTTSEAHDLLIRLKVKGKKRRHIVDKIAAGIILQDYLEAQCR
ncbi:MAG: Holliday junction resolvase RuvX [Bacteriovoracaceae bacterium]|nr:Holliday junction resolvase RuvX [Bacteriovoracaceae bacterium]